MADKPSRFATGYWGGHIPPPSDLPAPRRPTGGGTGANRSRTITEPTAERLIAALDDLRCDLRELHNTIQTDIYERRKARAAVETNGPVVSGEEAAAFARSGMAVDEPA